MGPLGCALPNGKIFFNNKAQGGEGAPISHIFSFLTAKVKGGETEIGPVVCAKGVTREKKVKYHFIYNLHVNKYQDTHVKITLFFF